MYCVSSKTRYHDDAYRAVNLLGDLVTSGILGWPWHPFRDRRGHRRIVAELYGTINCCSGGKDETRVKDGGPPI